LFHDQSWYLEAEQMKSATSLCCSNEPHQDFLASALLFHLLLGLDPEWLPKQLTQQHLAE